MKPKKQDKVLNVKLGHQWEKQDCWTINWSGCVGTMLCKRCLNIVEIERPNNTSPYKYSNMRDMFGKLIDKNKWGICSVDLIKEIKEEQSK